MCGHDHPFDGKISSALILIYAEDDRFFLVVTLHVHARARVI